MAEKPIARAFADLWTCPKPDHNPTFPLIPATWPVNKLVDGFFQVIRLGDYGIELGGMDVVAEGSATNLVCGLPIARQGDHLLHGGVITTGSPTEFDGGPTFSLPPNIKIAGTATFKNKVVRDLYYLSTLPNGKKILDGIAANGQEVAIVSGDNSSFPDDPDAAKAGRPTSTQVNYDPDKSDIYVKGEKGGYSACPPQLNLGHELIHGLRWGKKGSSTSHGTEEEAVIGPPYGKKRPPKDWPTENGLRKDMGLGPRTGYDHKIDEANPAKDLRPGQCPGAP